MIIYISHPHIQTTAKQGDLRVNSYVLDEFANGMRILKKLAKIWWVIT
jgi:hypothetical protein